MTPDLCSNLRDAWLEKAQRALVDLNHAAQAPALFKPEWIERAQADYAKAVTQARFWGSQR